MASNQSFKALALSALSEPPALPQVQHAASPGDPALALLTDLHHSACVVAHHTDGLPETRHLMMRAGVKMVFVAGAAGEVIGLVTAEDLDGERAVMRASHHHVPHKDLTVADVMIPVSRWDTVDLAAVRKARLGDIVATMHENDLRYLIVTQQKDGKTVLRGLFSARRLEMAMNTTIEPDLHSRNFAELGRRLTH